jgi:phosphomannomutase
VRASNTQPVLVLRFEAKTKESLKKIIESIAVKIREIPSVDSSALDDAIEDL